MKDSSCLSSNIFYLCLCSLAGFSAPLATANSPTTGQPNLVMPSPQVNPSPQQMEIPKNIAPPAPTQGSPPLKTVPVNPVGKPIGRTPNGATERRQFHPFLGAGTDAPFFVGGNLGVRFYEHFSVNAGYGIMPSVYSGFIGSAVDKFANKTGFESVLKGVTNSNHVLRFGADFHLSGRRGLSFGGRFYQLKSKGESSITDVETLTGTQFPVLKGLLNAQGKELIFNSDLDLSLLELHLGYTFSIVRNLWVETGFGVSKVIGNSVTLSSNAPAFDSSAAGQAQYQTAQEELDSVLKKYGYSPILSAQLIYEF